MAPAVLRGTSGVAEAALVNELTAGAEPETLGWLRRKRPW